MPLAGNWWFWALVATVLAIAGGLSGRYRSFAAAARRGALRRGLVELPAGHGLRRPSGGFWGDLSWLALPAGAWVILGPWTWGYEEVSGAVETDTVTGACVIVIALGAIAFPALWTLNLFAGLWLVVAPWLVGYGDANGPVGLSDAATGVLICALAIVSLSSAERALRPTSGGGKAIGRIRPPPR